MKLTLRHGALLALLLALPATALAQARVHGTIRDSAQGMPLSLVEVLVEGTGLATRTDAAGRYSLNVPLGIHALVFRRVGYHPARRELRVSSPDSLRFDLVMVGQAQRLDSVQVVAPAGARSWPPGIEDRKKEGFGTFITDSLLRRFDNSSLPNALSSRAGTVRIRREQGRSVAMAARGGRATFDGGSVQNCFMAIWVDGMLIWKPDVLSGGQASGRVWQSDTSIPPDLNRWAVVGLEAIEVYTAAQVPSLYRGDGAGCGVVLLWTRKDLDPDKR